MRLLAVCLALCGALFLTGPAQAQTQNTHDAGVAAQKRGDFAAAAGLYQQACNDGNAHGCIKLGLLYGRGTGVTKDEVRAAGLFQQGCNGGDAWGCINLGNDFFEGTGVTKDNARAAGLYQQGCNGGIADGCILLGALYEYGVGVTADKARALELYRKAQSLGPNAELSVTIGEAIARLGGK